MQQSNKRRILSGQPLIFFKRSPPWACTFKVAPHAQGKLVRVVKGAVWDVAVDLIPGSPTYGQHFGLELTEENGTMLYIPPGFGHGFLTLEDNTHFLYKCTAEYAPESDGGVKWNDPDLAVSWPLEPGPGTSGIR